ncbi:MAG: anti-sigma factor domain-containing protein [Acidothermaceae bacterium]
MDVDDHERWAELAAGHVLSSLDEVDEAAYLEHSSHCESCRQLELDLSETLGELAQLPPQLAPPPSLRASIMKAVIEDDEKHTATVVPIDFASARPPGRASNRKPVWMAAAAAGIAIVVAGSIAWGIGGQKQASVAARCAKVSCPTITLDADGSPVATVMVLDKAAYVQADGLPATPSGHTYVLWRISAGKSPVGVAAFHTGPSAGPVKAGSITVPVSDLSGFAISEEPGDSVPAAPTHVIAQGSTT